MNDDQGYPQLSSLYFSPIHTCLLAPTPCGVGVGCQNCVWVKIVFMLQYYVKIFKLPNFIIKICDKVPHIGFEPIQPEGTGFTDQPDSPTSAVRHVLILQLNR